MSNTDFFLRIIGVGDAKFGMIWFMLAILGDRLFDVEKTISCKHAFPPVMGVEQMISFAIEASLGEDANSSIVRKKMAPWTTALAKISDDLAQPSRPRDLMKGAAALSVLSALLSPIIIILSALYFTLLRGHIQRWMLYALALLDALLFVGSGVMVGYAMREGPRGIIELAGIPQEDMYGPGNIAFTMGALVN
ncbi:hypothetical protein ACLX1H_004936 [Fusarium chlamydosporum]